MFKAVIFDMDGVIVDTEPLYDAHRVVYLKKLGHKIDPKHFEEIRGMSARGYWEIMIARLNLEHDIEFLIKDARNHYFEFLMSHPNLKLNPGVERLINKLSKAKIRLVLASSASLRRITAVLEKFNLTKHFEFIICGDDVQKAKPSPDIYLLAAEKLNLKPKECLVIEDAKNGVEAAKKAGMKVVGYKPNSNKQDLSKADLIIKTFEGINLNSF